MPSNNAIVSAYPLGAKTPGYAECQACWQDGGTVQTYGQPLKRQIPVKKQILEFRMEALEHVPRRGDPASLSQ